MDDWNKRKKDCIGFSFNSFFRVCLCYRTMQQWNLHVLVWDMLIQDISITSWWLAAVYFFLQFKEAPMLLSVYIADKFWCYKNRYDIMSDSWDVTLDVNTFTAWESCVHTFTFMKWIHFAQLSIESMLRTSS